MTSRIDPGTLAAALTATICLLWPISVGTQDLPQDDLEHELGRREVRVWSAPFVVSKGGTVEGLALPERLAARGYLRVHRRPERPGEYFWGHDVFWIFQRPYRHGGRSMPGGLRGLRLERPSGRVTGALDVEGKPDRGSLHLEPVLLAESLDADRAPRLPIELPELPEHVWRTVLAAEDSRFFDHVGLDARGIARALLRNARAGEVVQGGSTITQQLIKMRELTPKRTLGRKVSEALRALALEADYDKREILETYLDHVYLGHVEGLAVHGYGAAAQVYFGKPATELDLVEAAMLAAMIQGPNRLSPLRHPDRLLERQRWVLSRLEELGWAERQALRRARGRGLPRLRVTSPEPPPARAFLSWLRDFAAEELPGRTEEGLGLVVETTLDALLQETAEHAVAEELDRLERRTGRRGQPGGLEAALVALDADTGDVLAYVGNDPRDRADAFDRARNARRQPGSTVKPLVLLEAFDRCGRREPLHPATRIVDRPLTLDLPSGPWSPSNPGGGFAGVVDARRALVESRNVPFVRIARWCGFDATADRLRETGLDLPAEAPPSFVLGAVETSPLELAQSYTAFGDRLGRVRRSRPVTRLERPGGGVLLRRVPRREKVTRRASAFLVRDLLRQALAARRGGDPLVADGAWGKTGTSSGGRDGWLAGGAGSLVVVVWVGFDEGGGAGLSGARDAYPFWRRFVEAAIGFRALEPPETPSGVVEAWVEEATGRRVGESGQGTRKELFRRGARPPERRWWRPDPPLDPIE